MWSLWHRRKFRNVFPAFWKNIPLYVRNPPSDAEYDFLPRLIDSGTMSRIASLFLTNNAFSWNHFTSGSSGETLGIFSSATYSPLIDRFCAFSSACVRQYPTPERNTQ